ncbi:MAG: phosphopantothenoylcysteine decarboxylase [Phycisphaerae bacterium]|nr:phosphopantothenoylcysteine decarboxylase [Phycisphaerae bacterium]
MSTNAANTEDLAGREVLLAVTGGIAAFKAATVASRLVQRGCGVSVAMTSAARRFITPLTFRALTGRPVYTSIWRTENPADQQHLTLTERADVFIIAPATADIIGRIAAGLGDDLVSTLALSVASPVLLAPAMNTRMWENPIVQRNLSALCALGWQVVEPGEGWLACRTVGKGRMAEPEEIVERAVQIMRARV